MLAAKFAPQLRQIAHHVSQALSEEHHVGSYNGVHLRLEEDVKGHVDSQATHSSPLSPPCVTAGSKAAHGVIREAFLCVLALGAMLMEMLALQDSQPVDYETVNSLCSFIASCLNVRLCAGCTSRAETLPYLYIMSSLGVAHACTLTSRAVSWVRRVLNKQQPAYAAIGLNCC